MIPQHLLDQGRAAAAHGNRFRTMAKAAGRFLTRVEGPLAGAVIAWTTAPKTRCEHLPADASPQPLFGSLANPGVMCCLGCSPILCEMMPPTCAGCGADLDLVDAETPTSETEVGDSDHDKYTVVVGVDHFLTLIGYACPDCRAQCEPVPT